LCVESIAEVSKDSFKLEAMLWFALRMGFCETVEIFGDLLLLPSEILSKFEGVESKWKCCFSGLPFSSELS